LAAGGRGGLRNTGRALSKPHPIQNPVALTRSAIASGNSRDYEAMMAFYGPESTVDLTGVGLGRYAGPSAIRQFFEEWIGSSEEIEFHLEEADDLGNGIVLAAISQRARPTGSKGFLQLRYAAVYLWRDGLTIEVTHYRDADEARAAAERLTEKRS
jgi:ketosteroid isomerase-like protein